MRECGFAFALDLVSVSFGQPPRRRPGTSFSPLIDLFEGPILVKRRAFTLIELLVVIAIIAVLIALLAARCPGRPRGGQAGPVHQ